MDNQKTAELEALLFHYGEPISLKQISKLLNTGEDVSENLLKDLNDSLDKDAARGLTLLKAGGKYQLTTKPALQKIFQNLLQEELKEELSKASLEALSIIAYLGPLARLNVDYIRGVNSSFTLRNLLVRGLIERETSAKKGNVYYYNISADFLKHMGLKKQEDLADYEKYKNTLKKLEISAI